MSHPTDTACRRCGTCCRKGGPALHREDRHLVVDGLIPADVYFDAESEVRAAMEARVAKNALDLAKHGEPRKPFYLTGRVGEQSVSLHAEGERVIMTKEDGSREEVDLGATGHREDDPEDDDGELAEVAE
jgi:hypothetical protein